MNEDRESLFFDIAVVGAGPAGMTAAVYGQRAGKRIIVLDELGYGGNIVNTPLVENFPGIQKISGAEFAQNLYEQMLSLGAEYRAEEVESIIREGNWFKVKTSGGLISAKAVIIAVGVRNRKLGIKGEEKLIGSGVSFCATCDGNFFRNRDVAVIGGGNTALEDAEYLSAVCRKVYLVHRRNAFRGSAITAARLEERENVEFVLDSIPEEILGDYMVTGLKVKNVRTEEIQDLEVSGIFEAVGQIPANDRFQNLADLDEYGYLDSGEDCRTKTPGVFAAGDCRRKAVRQLTTASADGSVAALAASEYINALDD